MDLRGMIHDLLKEIGPGQKITRSAYDTAWLARLGELDEPMSERALDWLRAQQLLDGSWGASELEYFHDRVICTLAAMAAFAAHGSAQDKVRLRRAQTALEKAIKGLKNDPAGETVGFEMLLPTLMTEAETLGAIPRRNGNGLSGLARRRAGKLAVLPNGLVNRHVTVAFSAEMVGADELRLLDVDNLQEANGSVAYSPAATAFFALNVRQDPAAMGYLHQVSQDGAVPYVAPIDVFELSWTLWSLALTGPLDAKTLALCQPHLDFLAAQWEPGQGIAAVAGLSLLDGDDTALTFEVLKRFGRSVDLEGLLHYEEQDHFRCYGLETNPSISTNVHALGALRQAGLGVQQPPVQTVLRFLRQMQTSGTFWFDKWHASPFYPTTHAVVAAAGYDDDLVQNAVHWILQTQHADGSWGYYVPTAEETAYCLQALVTWKRQGGRVPDEVLKRGASWLADHTEPPYPPLWIGKCLYGPTLVLRAAILSALSLVSQETS